ncbi:Condensin complex subunit [Mortierella sp. AD010]|nr:Condensin complex subunit [Mortierella sp. AD010]
MSYKFELDEELDNVLQESVHIQNEIPIEGENKNVLERILNVWDIILSGFGSEISSTAEYLNVNDQEIYMQHRDPLEIYGFLIFWIINITEQKATSRVANLARTKILARGKSSQPVRETNGTVEGPSAWMTEKQKAMDLMSECLELNLSKIWTTTPERETFVSLFFKPAYQILENKENVKSSALKQRVYKVLCICILRYNHEFGARTTILQNLQYWEHTPEPMAELLEMLVNHHDYSQLADNILRDISPRKFDETIKDTNVPRAFSKFLVKLSEIAPKVVLRQMGLLIEQLDGELYIMRQTMLEVIGNLIAYLSDVEQTVQVKDQIDGFFDILEERFMDINSYVRTKLLQIVSQLCDLRVKFPKRRQRLTELVIGRLSDKSSWTRKQAIKTLIRIIETHPYSMHGGELDLEDWEIKYMEVTNELKDMIASPLKKKAILRGSDGNEDDMEIDEPDSQVTEDEEGNTAGPTDEELLELQSSKEYITKTLQQRYYADAIRFIHLLHSAIPVMCEILASAMKLEVIEAMEFFVIIHQYKVKGANDGIRKMVHLVWVKDHSDETKSVRSKLVDCYWQIYLAPEDALSEKENTALIARNLVSLTYGSTLAELVSLEQLLSTMIADPPAYTNKITISDKVIEKLWQVYSHHKSIPSPQRRGAIIILGMLAKAKPDIVANKIETILKIGLGKHGKADLALARYSCIALQRITGEKKRQKGVATHDTVRLPMDHPIFVKLSNFIDNPTTSKNWFSVVEQALNTIYLLGEHPDALCGDIIKSRCRTIFNLQESSDSPLGQMSVDTPMSSASDKSTMSLENAFMIDSWQLSQLFFIVGHVAIKHIVHMEIIEEEFKRRKAAAGNEKKKGKENAVEDELDQVVGTTEDEFGDVMDKTLQSSATLALCKLMCVSSEFCEQNLQLLFTILEKSTEPTIRSNIIIALGDMAVCFHNLIEANISYLFKRLSDSETAVKKDTLMVLTHLILNGMIKVKGQLGEMAICLVDEDARINGLARLFFTELTSKDNAVYNNMPDIISQMSNAQVEEDSYRKIIRFLFELIKDKNMESMTEKLCQRFRNTDEPRGWRDIAFCLSMLPFKTEKCYRKLLEGFPHFQDKVGEKNVFGYLFDIVVKGRAIKPPKPDIIKLIDEFEGKLMEYRAKCHESQDTEANSIAAIRKESHRRSRKREIATGLRGKQRKNGDLDFDCEFIMY